MILLCTWDGHDEGFNPDEYAHAIAETAAGQVVRGRWSVHRTRDIPPGTRIFLLRQQTHRGLLASGTASTGEVFERPHWADDTKTARYIKVDWDLVLPLDDRVTTEELEVALPDVQWRFLQASGTQVPVIAESSLEALWSARAGARLIVLPGEEDGFFEEGGKTRVEVNRYERDPAARKACLAHHGRTCHVCGFDFAQRYGDLGVNYIVVHHVRELSTLGAGYKVDPVEDLVPVCANCHAMLHRRRPALLPHELRELLRSGP